MDRPHLETQYIREEYNRRKNRGKCPRERPRDKYIGQIKKKVRCKKCQEANQLPFDRVGWRAAVNQS
jgi:hypothetical protein